jgi:hypothetical protein
MSNGMRTHITDSPAHHTIGFREREYIHNMFCLKARVKLSIVHKVPAITSLIILVLTTQFPEYNTDLPLTKHMTAYSTERIRINLTHRYYP